MLFLHSALAQTKDYSSSDYSCTHFRSYDTPVRTRNKWGLDTKHDLKQAGMGVDTWGFEIISNKDYLVSKCVKNGRHSKVERCRQVTITKFNMQRERERERVGWRRGRHGGGGGGCKGGEGERERKRRGQEWMGLSCWQPLPRRSPNNRELKNLRTRVQRILLPAMICTRNFGNPPQLVCFNAFVVVVGGAQTVVSSLQTSQIMSDVCFITDHVAYASSNKTKIVGIEMEHLFFCVACWAG